MLCRSVSLHKSQADEISRQGCFVTILSAHTIAWDDQVKNRCCIRSVTNVVSVLASRFACRLAQSSFSSRQSRQCYLEMDLWPAFCGPLVPHPSNPLWTLQFSVDLPSNRHTAEIRATQIPHWCLHLKKKNSLVVHQIYQPHVPSPMNALRYPAASPSRPSQRLRDLGTRWDASAAVCAKVDCLLRPSTWSAPGPGWENWRSTDEKNILKN